MRTSTIRRPAMISAAVALVAGLAFVSPSPASAEATPMCMGRVATVVLTAENPDYTDTVGVRDVVVDVAGVANVITTGRGVDRICAGDGDDVIDAGVGRDRVNAGAGNDRVDAGRGPDIVQGGDGDDVLIGRHGTDFLNGGAGNDSLSGSGRADTLRGGEGDDRLVGGTGDDIIDGGPGRDRIIGHRGADVIDGGDDPDLVRAGAGGDVVRGGGGNDRLYGQGDADEIWGGEGNDRIVTGEGNETLGFGHPYRNDVAHGGPGNDVILGGTQRDWLYGDDGVDRIRGGAGDDLIVTGTGADTAYGGDGYDQIWSGPGFARNDDVDALVDGGAGFDACEAANDRVACEDPHGERHPEEWRDVVTEVFTAWGIEQEIDNGLAVLACESVGDPFARNTLSDTRGLFQHRPFASEADAPDSPYYWGARVQRIVDGHLDKATGFPTEAAQANPFDPHHNAHVAALLVWESVNHPEWGGPWGTSFAWYPWGHWHCGKVTYELWVAGEGDPSRWLIPNDYGLS